MTTDLEIRRRVVDELEFQPGIDAAHIGVAVRNGIVTLTGRVGSFAEKQAAEKAARYVEGVKAVAQDIEVHYAADPKLGDDEIAGRAVKILEWHMAVPRHRIEIKVDHGVVTLTGEVDWYYQKMRAEEDVRRLGGVREVLNDIEVVLTLKAEEIRQQIVAALQRASGVNAESITVVVDGGKVTLHGKVRTEEERSIAGRVAWSPRGVSDVENDITVGKHSRRKTDDQPTLAMLRS